ncbi:MAG: HTTM domain-containing protein [Gracilimonas sp.]|uniref:HTTM domain-containing protein n=1 Tax=Gracilimonas sp. TaxID=1974203 RepID=UPI00199D88E1|nr:HTTM domain-containing protein [Gracilimonas sp.]MBD3615449.1 HTTM domain-containing protein [Gracilimonas sp.]
MYTYESSSFDRYKAFQLLWVIFILFHMLISSPGWTSIGDEFLNPSNHFFLAVNILVVLFAVASLLRPKHMLYFLLTLICLTIVKLDALPSVPNHIILVLIIHFTIFTSFFFFWNSSLKSKERIAAWFDKTAPYIRIELLILYFFVVLHKLNHDYFDPTVSCSVELYHEITSILPFLPQEMWVDGIMIWLILLIELTIPLLLLFSSTRVLGVFTGLVFHFLLSLHPNLYILSFTAELYALYILFLPSKLVLNITREFKKGMQRINIKRIVLVLSGTVILTTLIYFTINILQSGSISKTLLKNIFSALFSLIPVFWSIWCLLLITGAFLMFRGYFFHTPENTSPFFKISWSPLLIFPLLTIFNGITPYIGLKTATNFSMFSNLKVDGADNNHLFLPSKYQVSDFQNDTVILLNTNNSYLQAFINRHERMTYFELSRFLYENRSENIHVTFIRNGSKQTVRLPEQKASLSLESPWIARKLLLFRGIPDQTSTPCQW